MNCLAHRWLTAIAAILVAASAHAQIPLRLEPMRPQEAALPFIALEIPVTMENFAAAYSAYLEGFQKLIVDVDEDITRFRGRYKLSAGAGLGPEEAAALHAINGRTVDSHSKLVGELAERIKSTVPPERAVAVDQARDVLALRLLNDLASSASPAPPDIGERFMFILPEIRREIATIRVALTANLANRTSAYRAFIKARDAYDLVQADLRQKAGLAGLGSKEANKESSDIRERYMALRKAPEENKADIEALEVRINALGRLSQYRTKITAEWLAVAREEMVALREVESKGALSHFMQWLMYDIWLPRLVAEFPNDIPVVNEQRHGGRQPREVVRDVMRLPGLTQEQQDTARTMGRALVNAYRDRIRKAAEGAISANSYKEIHDRDGSWFLAELNKIGVAIGHPEIGVKDESQFALVPTVGLTGTLSASDADEFGAVQTDAKAARSSARWYARSTLRPVPYPDDFAQQMQELLRIPAEYAAVVQAVASDAETCFNERIKPRLSELNPRPEIPYADTDEWRAEQKRMRDVRTALFQAAAECDNHMLDALAAGLGDKSDLSALAVLRASLRTAECSGDGGFNFAAPLDAPRAVLEAPLSETARRAMMEEFASLGPQWTELAAKLLRAKIAVSGDMSVRESEEIDAKKIDAGAEASAAWTAAETLAIERMASRLSPSDADAWRAWVRACQWPRSYYGSRYLSDMVRKSLEGIPDADKLRAQIEPIVVETTAASQRTGDATVEMLLKLAPRSAYLQTSGVHQDLSRTAMERAYPYTMVNMAQSELAQQRIVHMLPAEAVRRMNVEPMFAAAAPTEEPK